jgi:2-oxoglutarate ferredoxin oxidoreductase subunit beta
MKEHEEPIHEIDFIPHFEDIQVEIPEGETREVTLHDGSRLRLHKLGADYDPTDKLGAINAIHHSVETGDVLTGVLYVDAEKPNLIEQLNIGDAPLATLPESKVRPSRAVLEQAMEELR